MRRLHLCLLAFLPALACAQSATPLSLAEVEALWREHSRELRMAAAMVDAAAGDLKTAGQAPNPELSLNFLQISRNSGTTTGNWLDKKVDSQLRIDQLIERGGKRELRQRSAGARLEAAHLDLADTSRQQLAELRRAYFDLKLLQEKAALAAETAALYARSVEAAQKRLKAGDLAPVDVARLGIDQSRADSEARAVQAELVQARQALAYLIGRESTAAGLSASDSCRRRMTRCWLMACRRSAPTWKRLAAAVRPPMPSAIWHERSGRAISLLASSTNTMRRTCRSTAMASASVFRCLSGMNTRAKLPAPRRMP